MPDLKWLLAACTQSPLRRRKSKTKMLVSSFHSYIGRPDGAKAQFRIDMGKTIRRKSNLQSTRADATQMRQALQWVEPRRAKIHGRGVFARRDIPAGIQVIQYVGRRIS